MVITLFSGAIIVIIFIIMLISDIIRDLKKCKMYLSYLDSIKIGDVFVHKDEYDDYDEDPFNYEYEKTKWVICDVKKNNKGVKYVQYYLKEYAPNAKRFSARLEDFIKYKKRIGENEDIS